MKFIALGRTEVLYETVQFLVDQAGHELTAVLTAPARPEALRAEPDFQELAAHYAVPYRLATRFDEPMRELIDQSGAEVAVSVNWVSVIESADLKLLPNGILNAHAGDLPRYRGNAVTNWAILAGEPEIAVCVHRMVSELDAGPVFARAEIPITETTTIADVNAAIAAITPRLFARALDVLPAGDALEQPSGEGFRCYPRLPRDGRVDWDSPAVDVARLVRSLAKPYSGAFTHYRDADDVLHRLWIWEARVVAETSADRAVPGHVLRNDPDSGESWVACADGGVLALAAVAHGQHDETFAPGRVWRTIRMRLGLDLESEIYRLVSGSERR